MTDGWDGDLSPDTDKGYTTEELGAKAAPVAETPAPSNLLDQYGNRPLNILWRRCAELCVTEGLMDDRAKHRAIVYKECAEQLERAEAARASASVQATRENGLDEAAAIVDVYQRREYANARTANGDLLEEVGNAIRERSATADKPGAPTPCGCPLELPDSFKNGDSSAERVKKHRVGCPNAAASPAGEGSQK